MPFVDTLEQELKNQYKDNPHEFYFNQIIDTYAHAQDPAVRLDALKLLMKLEKNPNYWLIINERHYLKEKRKKIKQERIKNELKEG